MLFKVGLVMANNYRSEFFPRKHKVSITPVVPSESYKHTVEIRVWLADGTSYDLAINIHCYFHKLANIKLPVDFVDSIACITT